MAWIVNPLTNMLRKCYNCTTQGIVSYIAVEGQRRAYHVSYDGKRVPEYIACLPGRWKDNTPLKKCLTVRILVTNGTLPKRTTYKFVTQYACPEKAFYFPTTYTGQAVWRNQKLRPMPPHICTERHHPDPRTLSRNVPIIDTAGPTPPIL